MYMMTQKQSLHPTVMKFIARFTNNGKRREVIDCFTSGCCYWFAEILWNRFALEVVNINCDIVYDPIINHWACQIDGIIYDITGVITRDEYQWESWVKFQYKDELLTKRLYRDCINFGGPEDDLV